MRSKKIIIDCDPGQDDAINLLLAMASPDELDILGITAVVGNVPLDLTQRNSRIICELANRLDIDVYAGCSDPTVRKRITAEYVHGDTGIDGLDAYEPDHPLHSQHAVDYIIETLHAEEEGTVTLVPTGPLTNIAVAFDRDPSIVPKVAHIILMGGAMREGGNRTPSAEFNILADPHAAETVFGCGRPLTVFGLDVTHKVLSTKERVERIRDIGNKAALATASMLDFSSRYDNDKYGGPGAPLHDPCTIAYMLKPELFKGRLCNISIETQSELTMGNTAVDFWRVTDKPQNATWIHDVDADGFYALLTERLARF